MNSKNRNRYLMLGLGALVAAVAVLTFVDLQAVADTLAAAVAGGSMLAIATALPDVEFQTKVLEGVDKHTKSIENVTTEIAATKSRIDKLTSNYEQLDKDTKAAFEDLTRIKNAANDMTAAMNAMQRVQLQLQRESRMAFGDPIARIQADEELRQRLNIAFRLAVDDKGDMQRLIRAKFPSDLVKKALGEDSSPGSTMIDDRLAAEIYDTLSTFGVWNTFRVQKLGTKQTKFPVKTARPVANFILTEGGTIADDTNKAGTSVTLEVEVIAVLLNVSRQLLDDSEFDVSADVLTDFAEAYANRLDVATLTADGTADATNGGMTGVFQGGTLVAAAATEDTVEELDLEDFMACLTAVDAQVLSRPARWWAHPHQVIRTLGIKDSNGRPIFLTANEAPTPGGIGSILGYPVTLAQAAPSTNTANTRAFTFGDPNGMVVGVRTDFMFEASDQFRWNTFERSFRGVGRAGTKIRRSAAFANLRLTT